jgi:hypothetical protein
MIRLEHYLIAVALLCVAIIILVLISFTKQTPKVQFPKKYIPKKHHNIPESMCDPRKKPMCTYQDSVLDASPVCVLNERTGREEWHCDVYKLIYKTDNLYPSEFGIITSTGDVSTISDAEKLCEDLEGDCESYQWNSQGWLKYSPKGDENTSIVSGYRLLPNSSNIFLRKINEDLTNVFSSNNSKNFSNRVISENECQRFCFKNSCFGYVYNKDTNMCDAYYAIRTSGTGKHLKNID